MFCVFFCLALQATPEPGGIKFPDFKQSGVSLRSQRVGIFLIRNDDNRNCGNEIILMDAMIVIILDIR